jgi:hypothetical protein
MCDYDDPEVEAKWLSERRFEVAEYLQGEGVIHGKIAEEPAWYQAPYLSLWAIESFERPGSQGWWVISGDLPNDYVSVSKAGSPREAIQAIATLWREASEYMERGELHPSFVIGSGEQREELAPLLASRAEFLLEWAADSEVWDEA